LEDEVITPACNSFTFNIRAAHKYAKYNVKVTFHWNAFLFLFTTCVQKAKTNVAYISGIVLAYSFPMEI